MKTLLIAATLVSSLAFGHRPVDRDDDVTVRCTSFSDAVTAQQMAVIGPMLAQRPHRLWHLFFHGVRAAWSDLSSSDRNLLAAIHPTLVPKHAYTPTNKIASVDFLYYHRIMSRMVQGVLIEAGLPCIGSWAEPPAPQNTNWPVPALWPTTNPLVLFGKSSAGYTTMADLSETQFHNDAWLTGKKFAEVAASLENSIHGLFHGRFAAKPNVAKRPYLNIFLAPHQQYDAESYDYLIDTYSTMGNKHFWKIHLYLDDVINKWLHANGYSSIAVNCQGAAGCYQWDTTWIGPDPEVICDCDEHEGEAHAHEIDVLTLFFDYGKANPLRKPQLDRLLYEIDYSSAPGGNR